MQQDFAFFCKRRGRDEKAGGQDGSGCPTVTGSRCAADAAALQEQADLPAAGARKRSGGMSEPRGAKLFDAAF